jgi:serine/threonine-protein kinase
MIATDLNDRPEPEGESLRERLRACQRAGLTGVPVPELLQYIAEIAAELDGYERPHADVTPDTIHVVDGKARLGRRAARGPVPTPGSVVSFGAPAYMAPEVWGGAVGPGSDQYALACVYAELRTGHLPFQGQNCLTVMRGHIEAAPDLEGCSEAELQVLTRALAKAAIKRYPSCRDFAKQLSRAVSTGR